MKYLNKSLINNLKLLATIVTIIVATTSFIGSLLYAFTFVESIEKRVSILEQTNSIKDKNLNQFETEIDSRLLRIEDKLDKTYMMLAGRKYHEELL